jgi:NADPH:quinone reductase-like Zn-dependent oxidoreductase
MKAIALDRFGGIETLSPRTLPVPDVGPDEILIRVESAGVGEWDPFEREGGFAGLSGAAPRFPYVLGSDGAGSVAAAGRRVAGLREGDRVFACSLAGPKGGFYAQYAAVKAKNAAIVPDSLPTAEAGALMMDGITALRGLDNTLGIDEQESLLIFGAGGGVGHLAVQLAKRMGARVLAAASGEDGVALAAQLGADAVVDGRRDDVAAAARKFAPEGLDCALITAGGEAADKALSAVRKGGRVAYPNGVDPEPLPRRGVTVQGFNGIPDPRVIAKLIRLIESGPFTVHIARTFPLEQAAEAHRALESHYLGKLALRPF